MAGGGARIGARRRERRGEHEAEPREIAPPLRWRRVREEEARLAAEAAAAEAGAARRMRRREKLEMEASQM